jgi:hypothetical protein
MAANEAQCDRRASQEVLMEAVKLNGRVTEEGELVLDRPISLSPGPVEVLLLREVLPAAGPTGSGKSLLEAFTESGLVGTWADRTDISDSVVFTEQLREKLRDLPPRDEDHPTAETKGKAREKKSESV